MATMWSLIEMCFADAHRAEDLTRDLTARRELRLDPESALAGFGLFERTAARSVRDEARHGDRRRLGDPSRGADAEVAA